MTDFDASDRRAVRRAERLAKVTERARLDMTAAIMTRPEGRAWMWDLLSRCHVFATSFRSNALTMALAEGERNIGLQLLNDVMAASPDEYIVMVREAQHKEIANARGSVGERSGGADGNGRDQEPDLGNFVDYDREADDGDQDRDEATRDQDRDRN